MTSPQPQHSSDDDFTVTGDELDRCLDRAERAEAEVERLREAQGTVLGILANIRDEAHDTRDTENGHRYIERQAQRGIAALTPKETR